MRVVDQAGWAAGVLLCNGCLFTVSPLRGPCFAGICWSREAAAELSRCRTVSKRCGFAGWHMAQHQVQPGFPEPGRA